MSGRALRTAMALAAMAVAAALGAGAGDDTPEIRVLFTETFAERWRAGDADGLAELWTETGDWMSVSGSRRMRVGRTAIAEVWRIGLSGRETPEQRAIELEVQNVRRLADGLAQVDVEMTFGTEATAILREGMVAIVERTDDGWRIASARVARLRER